MNANLRKLGSLVHLSVLSNSVVTPPATPAEGDRYLVPAGATGAWAARVDDVAVFMLGAWTYYTPSEGWKARVKSLRLWLLFEDGAWIDDSTGEVPGAEPDPTIGMELSMACSGVPTEGECVGLHLFRRATILPVNGGASLARAGAVLDAPCVVSVQREGQEVGQIRFSANSDRGVFINASAIVFGEEDRLGLYMLGAVPETFRDIAFTFYLAMLGS